MFTTAHPDDSQLLAAKAGGTSNAMQKEIAQHLEQCSSCRQQADALEQVLVVARETEEVNPFQSKRMERELNRQLDSLTLAQRRHWAPPKVAAALLVAAFSGATFAMTAGGWRPFEKPLSEKVPSATLKTKGVKSQAPEQPEKAEQVSPQTDKTDDHDADTNANSEKRARPTALAAAQDRSGAHPAKTQKNVNYNRKETGFGPAHTLQKEAPKRTSFSTEPGSLTPNASAIEDAKPRKERHVAILLGTPSAKDAAQKGKELALKDEPASPLWNDVGDLFSMAGQSQDAMDAYVQALAGQGAAKARSRLDSLLADEPTRSAVLLESIARHRMAKSSAEGMRLLCELGLVHNQGRQAVKACNAFANAFPAHRSVRILLLAAGGRAAYGLHDDELAIELFSMALSRSEYGGLPSTKAMFARAGCYERLKKPVQARTDLQLFLKLEPEAAHRPDVKAMAKRLGVALFK